LYRGVKRSFGRPVEIFYSVKANNAPAILKTIADLGGAFDVASWSEVRASLAAGASPDRIAFSNTIKIPEEIAAAYKVGVRLFGFDSRAEIAKLAKLAPGSDLYVRLIVSNQGSVWPLNGKFGVHVYDAVKLLVAAKDAGLNPVGVTFHVGSQCVNPENWTKALAASAAVFRMSAENGVPLTLLNMGGGLPAMESMTHPPSIAKIGTTVRKGLREFPESVRLMIEPGRHLVSTAGMLVATVIGEAEREGEHWIYLDTGIYNGLMEIHEKFPYEVRTDNPRRPKRSYVMAGPTCDSIDIIFHKIELPELNVGDRVYFMNAGAYTTAYDRYNGFEFPALCLKK
jgi:ornithine decarboxylase